MFGLVSVPTLFVLCAVLMLLRLIKAWMQGPRCTSKRRLDGKTVVITGANNGIGKEVAKDLYTRGANVVMLCRNLEKARSALPYIVGVEGVGGEGGGEGSARVKVVSLDLSSLQSVRECAKRLNAEVDQIDILLNNAGIMTTPQLTTKEGYELQFGTNHLGHFLLTNLLLPLLRKGGPGTRVVTVSSVAHKPGRIHFDDINFRETKYVPITAYNQSKLANILFSNHLGELERENGIHTYSLHPGVIATDLFSNIKDSYGTMAQTAVDYFILPFVKSVESGAQTSIFCCVDESIQEHTGRYYSDCSEKLPAATALNKKDAERLWQLSAQLTKLDDSKQ